MSFSRILFSLSFLLFVCVGSSAQEANYDNYKTFSAIMVNGETMIKPNSPDGPLMLGMDVTGNFSVSAIDRKSGGMKPIKDLGFKIAIKNHRTNTQWLYSEETFFKLDIDSLKEKLEFGDMIIFLLVDRNYKLPRHEVIGLTGC